MKTIYKFPLIITPMQTVTMPAGAVILCVQMQGGVPTLWAELDLEDKWSLARVIRIWGTGRNDIDPAMRKEYIGTVQQDGFVWHFFEQTL